MCRSASDFQGRYELVPVSEKNKVSVFKLGKLVKYREIDHLKLQFNLGLANISGQVIEFDCELAIKE